MFVVAFSSASRVARKRQRRSLIFGLVAQTNRPSEGSRCFSFSAPLVLGLALEQWARVGRAMDSHWMSMSPKVDCLKRPHIWYCSSRGTRSMSKTRYFSPAGRADERMHWCLNVHGWRLLVLAQRREMHYVAPSAQFHYFFSSSSSFLRPSGDSPRGCAPHSPARIKSQPSSKTCWS